MAKGLTRKTLQEWRLLTISERSEGKGTKGTGTRGEIDEELKRNLSLLNYSKREIDAHISVGWNWTELKDKKLSPGKETSGD